MFYKLGKDNGYRQREQHTMYFAYSGSCKDKFIICM